MTIDAGVQHANREYWVLGSVTGTKPGIRLGDITIPLGFDFYTEFTISNPNTLIRTSRGRLDAKGRASASFRIPMGSPSAAVGVTVHHAFVTIEGGRFWMASNPVSVKLIR